MRIPATFTAIFAAAGLFGSTAIAQQQPPSGQSGSAGQQKWQKAETQEFFRADKIIGKSTQTANGQKLGSIKDIVFNQQAEIFALIDIGNGKWAAVPWQLANPSTAKGDQNIVLNTTPSELKAGPAVTKDQWGALDNPEFVQGIYSYYHVQQPAGMGGSMSPGGGSQGQGSEFQKQQK